MNRQEATNRETSAGVKSGGAALAHHWLVRMRGGEKVLEQLCLIFPKAPIYTIVAASEPLSPILADHSLVTSFLQHVPGSAEHYKTLLPLFPLAVSGMKVAEDRNFLFSTDASVIKGLRLPRAVPHVCYCHSPPRYLFDLHETYASHSAGMGVLKRLVFRGVTPYVRRFDVRAAQSVTEFIANSGFVKERIARHYGRDSTVIYPPVDVDSFDHSRPAEDFFLIVSELVPYKRVDIAIDAFNQLGRRLVVIGDGSEMEALRRRAGPTIQLLGRQPFSTLKDHYERCRALIYTQVEDFGITAVEAQASGRPVIALRQGGAVESILDGITGIFFDEQTVPSLCSAVVLFERCHFQPTDCRHNAQRFNPRVFCGQVKYFLRERFPERFSRVGFGD